MKHRYDLTLSTPRPLAPEELERVVRAALDELARVVGVPDDKPRHVRRGLTLETEEVRAA